MLEEDAKVVSTTGDTALVAIRPRSSCSSCDVKGACGTSIIASLFPSRNKTFIVENTLKAEVGQDVIVGLDEAVLQRASIIVYLLPVLGLILGAALGGYLAERYFSFPAEPASIVAGLSGMVLAFMLASRFSNGSAGKTQYQAKILSVRKQNIDWSSLEKS